jgi:hypothetical protein
VSRGFGVRIGLQDLWMFPFPFSHFAEQDALAKLLPPMPRNKTRLRVALAYRFEAKLR